MEVRTHAQTLAVGQWMEKLLYVCQHEAVVVQGWQILEAHHKMRTEVAWSWAGSQIELPVVHIHLESHDEELVSFRNLGYHSKQQYWITSLQAPLVESPLTFEVVV